MWEVVIANLLLLHHHKTLQTSSKQGLGRNSSYLADFFLLLLHGSMKKFKISWQKKKLLNIFLSSIKTKIAIKFPKKLFFFSLSLPKTSSALKGLISNASLSFPKNVVEILHNLNNSKNFRDELTMTREAINPFSPVAHIYVTLVHRDSYSNAGGSSYTRFRIYVSWKNNKY